MAKNRTTYLLEFKRSSAKLAVESEQSIAQTERELGVNTNALYAWVIQYGTVASQIIRS